MHILKEVYMKKIKNKKLFFSILFLLVLEIVGVTYAYYASKNIFENIFQADPYETEVVETFESPSNWTSGDTTEKTVEVTNKARGDIAVRISFEEMWEDARGNELSLTDEDGLFYIKKGEIIC